MTVVNEGMGVLPVDIKEPLLPFTAYDYIMAKAFVRCHNTSAMATFY